MNNKYLFICLFFCINQIFSYEVKIEIVVKDKKNKKKEEFRVLKLNSKKCFENIFFKVVLKDGKDALCLNHPSKDIIKKAATTFYHLNVAKKYFNEKLQYELEKKVVIRIEMSDTYSKEKHIVKSNQNFNGALTIPGGKVKSKSYEWGTEMWLFPSRKENRKKYIDRINQIASSSFGSDFRTEYLKQSSAVMVRDRYLLDYENEATIKNFSENYIGFEVLHFITKLLLRASIRKPRIDSALNPSVIYHEFVHIMLHRHIKLFRTPIVEGFAEYYAALILADNDLSNNFYSREKRLKKKKVSKYRPYFEHVNVDTTFLTNIMYQVSLIIAQNKNSKEMHPSLFFLKVAENLPSSGLGTIREDFLAVVMQEIEKNYKNNFPMIISINQMLLKNNFY